MNSLYGGALNYASSGSSSQTLTIKSSPPKNAAVATRLGVRSGFLTKRNEQLQWQRRYCALVPQTLLYYFDDNCAEARREIDCFSQAARGIIDLEYYTEVEIIAKRTIRLATPSDIPLRSFFFKAENDDECARWVSALSRERFFDVADERDAYQKLQAEFQMQTSATAEAVETLREAMAENRSAVDRCDARHASALRQLRDRAVELGLGTDAAKSLLDARDALHELAARLHFHMRKSAQLKTSIGVANRRHDEVELALSRRAMTASADSLTEDGATHAVQRAVSAVSVGSSLSADFEDRVGSDDATARLREIDDLREKLDATRRAREREATARAALTADKVATKAKVDGLQQHVALAARARVVAEQRAAQLLDQKRILVKEVKQLRRDNAEKNPATKAAENDQSHRHLALQRAGLAVGLTRSSSSSGWSDQNTQDRAPATITCERCGGRVEGPANSTCTCKDSAEF